MDTAVVLHELPSPFKINFAMCLNSFFQAGNIFQFMDNNRILLEYISNLFSRECAYIMNLPSACGIESRLVQHNKVAQNFDYFALELHKAPISVVKYFGFWNSRQIKPCFLVGRSCLLLLLMPF